MPGIPGPALCAQETTRFGLSSCDAFSRQAADIAGADHPVAAEKLRRARPQGMRYMHATRARGGTNDCARQPTPFFSRYNFDLPAE
jgi:hypothetical protein